MVTLIRRRNIVILGKMNTLIKVGIIFLIVGAFSFLGLMYVVLSHGVGASSNPPLTGWYAALITFIFWTGFFWYVYLIAGAVLILTGLVKKWRYKQ